MTEISDPTMPPLPVGLSALERSLVAYYAGEKGLSFAEVIRRMIRLYVDMDRAFEPERYLKFVKKQLADDPFFENHVDELLAVAKDYSKRRRDAPRRTLKPVPTKVRRGK